MRTKATLSSLKPAVARGRAPYADTTRAEALLAEIQQKKQLVAETFIDIGLALVELDEKKLWASLGYASLSKMLRARAVMGRSQAFKLMAVVRALPRRDALALGPEKAYALVRYASAPSVKERVTDIVDRGMLVRGRRRPLDEMTAREIARAAQRAAPRPRRNDPEEREATRAVEEARRVLAKRGVHATIELRRTPGAFTCELRVPVAELVRALG
jgi:hypothetical protein